MFALIASEAVAADDFLSQGRDEAFAIDGDVEGGMDEGEDLGVVGMPGRSPRRADISKKSLQSDYGDSRLAAIVVYY